jgi:hypothetical protein
VSSIGTSRLWKASDVFRLTFVVELTLGKVLGRGGFCVVNEITKIRLIKDEESTDDSHHADNLDDEHAIHNIIQNRPFMEAHCLRGKGNDCRYAFKRLQESCHENAHLYINGVVDLAVEARFLSVVRHPNIIKMRAMAATNPFSTHDPFFVVLDRLYDSTLPLSQISMQICCRHRISSLFYVQPFRRVSRSGER